MAFLETLEEYGISSAAFVFALAVGIILGVAFAFPTLAAPAVSWLVALAPAWLPIVLAVLFWEVWIRYRRADFISRQDNALIEVRIPRDIEKSPRAMELVFSGLAISVSESTFIDRWFTGGVRPWYSFELVSDGGRIHFYIWTRRRMREIIEHEIYAQYPNVEIYEVEDYAARIRWDPEKYNAWGCDFALVKPDPFPIKSYIDYELHKDPKEEYKIDPLAHLFEYLSTAKPGEQVWYQMMIRVTRDKRVKKGHWFAKEGRWIAEAQDEIEKIKEKATPKRKDREGNEVPGFMHLTPVQTDQIEAIERHIGKSGFDVGIRAIYLAEKDAYRPVMVGGLVGVFKQFSSANLNTLAPARWMTIFDYPWQDFRGIMRARTRRRMIDAYKRRSWFHPPFYTPHYVMSAEALATIYHFPSRIIQAPGLDRIPARKYEAPPNLPTA